MFESVDPRSRQYVVTTALVLIVILVVLGALLGTR